MTDDDAHLLKAWRQIADNNSGNPTITMPRTILAELLDLIQRNIPDGS